MWWRQKERQKERGEQDEVQNEEKGEKQKSPDSWAPLHSEWGGGEEKGGRTMASQRCDRTPKGSRVVYMHVCGNGQKCARLCVYVHEEGAGQEASINSRFSPTSRVHGACLRIQWGRHVSSSCRAELIIYRWLTLQCSSLMNLQVSETGYSKAKLYSYRYNLHKCAPQGSLLGFKVIMGSFKDTICSQEAKGTCTCLLDINISRQSVFNCWANDYLFT